MFKYFKILAALWLFLAASCQAMAEEILTWQDCIKEAAKNHPDLIAAEEEVKQTEASKKITASALWPQVDSNLDISRAKTSTATTSKVSNTFSYGVSADQLIFDGLKTINQVNTAKENIKAAKQQFRFTSVTVRFRLRSAFINLLTAQEMLHIREEIRKIRRDNLVLITLQYQSGLEHKGALMTAEANLAQADFDIVQAKRDVEVAQRQLTKEMGRTQLAPLEAKGNFEVVDTEKEKPDFELIAKNNPSLLDIIAQKNAAEYGIKSAYADFFPSLNGTVGTDKSGSRWPPANKSQWNVGLSLSLPIFEGGLRVAQVAQAKALVKQLQENERSTHDGLVYTLEQTWAALQDAIDNVGVQEKILAATEERSKIAQVQYATGFISFDNWIIIEDNLVQAKSDFLNARSNALAAEANWIQAKGETIEYE